MELERQAKEEKMKRAFKFRISENNYTYRMMKSMMANKWGADVVDIHGYCHQWAHRG